MKLKNRMVISFFVIILVPLILTGVAVTGFTMYQVWSLEKKYGIEGVTYENLSNNTMLLSKMTQKTFSTLEKTASSDPEKLEALGLTPTDIVNAVAAQSERIIIGDIGGRPFPNPPPSTPAWWRRTLSVRRRNSPPLR